MHAVQLQCAVAVCVLLTNKISTLQVRCYTGNAHAVEIMLWDDVFWDCILTVCKFVGELGKVSLLE